MKYTVGSLFAGIGGICKGFENAGAKIVWANEIDKNACITYRLNFNHKLYEEDINRLTRKDKIKNLPEVDIITSGFPCQAFSIAGYQNGFDDPRGNLFFETAKVIDYLRPKAFLLENVKHFVGHDKGKTFKVIKNVITEDLKYSFIPFILNSKDFGNIPQNRERIYIVGFKGESYIDYFSDKFDHYTIKEEDKYREILKKRKGKKSYTLNYLIPKPIKLTKSIREIIDNKKAEDRFYYKENHKYYKKLTKEVISEKTIYQWRRVYIRENKSNLCPTLTANMGTGGHNVPIIKDKWGIRKLTPEECLKFQGFDNYILPNTAPSHLYKQIGNSVTVPVIERIAKEILRVLNLRE